MLLSQISLPFQWRIIVTLELEGTTIGHLVHLPAVNFIIFSNSLLLLTTERNSTANSLRACLFPRFKEMLSSSLYLQHPFPWYIKKSCHSNLLMLSCLKMTSVSTGAVRQRQFRGDAQDPRVDLWQSWEQRHPLTFSLYGMQPVPTSIPNYKQASVLHGHYLPNSLPSLSKWRAAQEVLSIEL